MDDLQNSTPDNGSSATATLPPESATGTVQTDSDASHLANGQGAPVEDGFTHVDPNTLPPPLRDKYNNMLRDYKEKTTKLSETVKSEVAKATESLKSKAELYDQIAAQEEFVRQWNEYVQKSQSQNVDKPKEDNALVEMRQKLEEMERNLQLKDIAEVTESFATAKNDKGELINPEFDNLNSINIGFLQNGKEQEPFSLLRACIELSPGQNPQDRLANGYKMAKATYDSIFESGKKAGMGRIQNKIANRTLPPSNSTGEMVTLTDKKPRSAKEALDMARKGIQVSRE